MDDVKSAMDTVMSREDERFRSVSDAYEVELHLQSPEMPNLDIVDLPGLVLNAPSDEPDLPALTRRLIDREIKQSKERSLFLIAIPTGTAIGSMTVFNVLKDMDISSRSIGVFTKCDTVSKNFRARKNLCDLIMGRGLPPLCGYVGIMNEQLNEQDDKSETEFGGDKKTTATERICLQASAEMPWFIDNGFEEIIEAGNAGCASLLNKIRSWFQDYITYAWLPPILSKFKEEISERRCEFSLLGTPFALSSAGGGYTDVELVADTPEFLRVKFWQVVSCVVAMEMNSVVDTSRPMVLVLGRRVLGYMEGLNGVPAGGESEISSTVESMCREALKGRGEMLVSQWRAKLMSHQSSFKLSRFPKAVNQLCENWERHEVEDLVKLLRDIFEEIKLFSSVYAGTHGNITESFDNDEVCLQLKQATAKSIEALVLMSTSRCCFQFFASLQQCVFSDGTDTSLDSHMDLVEDDITHKSRSELWKQLGKLEGARHLVKEELTISATQEAELIAKFVEESAFNAETFLFSVLANISSRGDIVRNICRLVFALPKEDCEKFIEALDIAVKEAGEATNEKNVFVSQTAFNLISDYTEYAGQILECKEKVIFLDKLSAPTCSRVFWVQMTLKELLVDLYTAELAALDDEIDSELKKVQKMFSDEKHFLTRGIADKTTERKNKVDELIAEGAASSPESLMNVSIMIEEDDKSEEKDWPEATVQGKKSSRMSFSRQPSAHKVEMAKEGLLRSITLATKGHKGGQRFMLSEAFKNKVLCLDVDIKRYSDLLKTLDTRCGEESRRVDAAGSDFFFKKKCLKSKYEQQFCGMCEYIESMVPAEQDALSDAGISKTIVQWMGSCPTAKGFLTVHDAVTPVYYLHESIVQSWTYWKMKRDENHRLESSFRTLEGHSGAIFCLRYLGNRKLVITGSLDRTIRLWDTKSAECIKTIETNHEGAIRDLCVLGDGLVVSASKDGTIMVWDVSKGMNEGTRKGHSGAVSCLCVLGDGLHFASGSEDKTIKVWESESGKCVSTLTNQDGAVDALCSLGHTMMAAGSRDATVSLWQMNTGRGQQCNRIHTLKFDDGSGVNCVISLDQGAKVAAGSHSGLIFLWRVSDGECLMKLTGHTSHVFSLCTLKGGVLASGSTDKTILLWNIESGECVRTLRGHEGTVSCLLPLGDAETFASGSADKTLKLWHTS